MSEANLMRRIMVAVSRAGARVFRNNIGQYKNPAGEWIRYGLVNPGGSDLIGWTPVVVTQDMVGKTVAVFTALEVKTPGNSPTEEQAQFVEVVKSSGGRAGIVTSVEESLSILK